MSGLAQDVDPAPLLDDPARVHHGNAIGQLVHDAEIVGDEQDRHAELLLQVAQQLEDLCLDRDIQGRGGLIGDQQTRPGGERHGDHHALFEATGELMWIGVQARLGIGNPHALEQFEGAAARLCVRDALVEADRLHHLCTHRGHRVQTGHRLLEDHGDLLTANLAHRGHGEPPDVATGQRDLASLDASGLGHQAQDRESRHRLAATGFPHQSQHLSGRDLEIHLFHDGDAAAFAREGRGETPDLDDHLGAHWFSRSVRGSRMSRRASPTKFTASKRPKSAAPAALMFHQMMGSRESSLRA